MAEPTLDGVQASVLAQRLGASACELHHRVSSTMDIAHAAAERGAAAGMLIIADAQDAGRGRGGRQWSSHAGSGVWMTLVERPVSAGGLDVLSLRAGLFVAEALDLLAGATIRLKWPNDLYIGDRKLAGILIETRWREQRVEWVAVGLGVNLMPPVDLPSAAGLLPGVTRLQVLQCVVPALRLAAAADGALTADELLRYAARDLTAGRRIVQPAAGVVHGVGANGELRVDTPAGPLVCRSGSLVFSENADAPRL